MINLQDQEKNYESNSRPQTAIHHKKKAVNIDQSSIHDFDSHKYVRTNVREYLDTTSRHEHKCINCAECMKP